MAQRTLWEFSEFPQYVNRSHSHIHPEKEKRENHEQIKRKEETTQQTQSKHEMQKKKMVIKKKPGAPYYMRSLWRSFKFTDTYIRTRTADAYIQLYISIFVVCWRWLSLFFFSFSFLRILSFFLPLAVCILWIFYTLYQSLNEVYTIRLRNAAFFFLLSIPYLVVCVQSSSYPQFTNVCNVLVIDISYVCYITLSPPFPHRDTHTQTLTCIERERDKLLWWRAFVRWKTLHSHTELNKTLRRQLILKWAIRQRLSNSRLFTYPLC